jgi:hypothetical protein
MTQINASGLNCSRERALNEEVAAQPVSLLLFATAALEQGNKCSDVAVVGGAKHSRSDKQQIATC